MLSDSWILFYLCFFSVIIVTFSEVLGTFCCAPPSGLFLVFSILTQGYVYWFWREKKGERERNINVKEKH